MKGWTLNTIEQKKKDGLIKDYTLLDKKDSHKNENNIPGGRIVSKHFKKISKEKDFIARNLLQWCQERSLKLEEEYRFHQVRKWRLDWCVPEIKLAVEYEGGIFNVNGDHRSIKGVQRDIEKYNSAQALGWKVLRFTALNYEDLITELNSIL